MRHLIKTDPNVPWIPKPGEARLYTTDEIPVPAQCSTTFGFVFVEDRVLLTRLRTRDWDIPGGVI